MTTIEAGKFYRTRDGRKARVYATDGANEAHRIHGAILHHKGWGEGWWNSTWYSDGLASHIDESPSDLMSEWDG